MISIAGLRSLLDALAHVDCSSAQHEALEQAAKKLEVVVVESLSHHPGEDHATPWMRTGGLRASITHSSDENVAAVGSNDDVAVYQEMGTRTDPPRPFLAPAAALEGPSAVREIGEAMARALSDALK